jgi:hypothetical protein
MYLDDIMRAQMDYEERVRKGERGAQFEDVGRKKRASGLIGVLLSMLPRF